MNQFNFEKLEVYKEALELVDFVYKITKTWPSSERYILIDQLTRAAISVALNIAEGTSRTSKDFAHFLSTSRGSVYECAAVITIAFNRSYITQEEYKKAYESCIKLARMLTALKKSLNQ